MADGSAAKVVHILASLHVGDDPAGAVLVARRWFERGWELLGGPLRAMVDGRDPVQAAAVAPRGFETFMTAATEGSYTARRALNRPTSSRSASIGADRTPLAWP